MAQFDIAEIAKLAQIEVDAETQQSLHQDLNHILEMVDQMRAIDTEQIKPLDNPLEMVQRLRIDQVSENDQREKLLSVAPNAQDGYYLVPKVIEE